VVHIPQLPLTTVIYIKIVVQVVIMPQTFIIKLKDDIKRRVVIDKEAWDKEELKKGDYVKITIEKVNTENKR
jgi:hypothetical protein